MKTLSICKAGHWHIVRYDAGSENKVLDALCEMATDKRTKFDWFDASVLAHQLRLSLAKELKSFLKKTKSG